MPEQRGFTLIETVVTLAIVALLLMAGGIWTFGMHPGATAQTAAGVDAALAAARLLAIDGDGATVAFLPRPGGNGFAVRVYRGRPQPGTQVTPSTVMPVTSDLAVSEASLGRPPFALFLAASERVSGVGAYPIAGRDGVRFPTIASEPPCPRAGFVLTFRLRGRSGFVRSLACGLRAVPAPRPPDPSPTPGAPIVSPSTLTYRWPAAAAQRFSALEWGYTHWFASANGFACGDVARFPDVLPSPYSPPADPREALLPPSPPPMTPYSYPNSGGGSLNDAPATFPIEPQAAGLCRATIVDDDAQTASAGVQVMGWLTAIYGSRAYDHRTDPPLRLPASAFPKPGATLSLTIAKTYDSEPLLAVVAFDRACSPLVTFSSRPLTTPQVPSQTPATALLSLQLVTMPRSQLVCGGTMYDQYHGSLAGEGVPFNLTLGAACPDAGNAWTGPTDGICYDLYAIPLAVTQTPGWMEESLLGFYVPHATPGIGFYRWVVVDGTCSLQRIAGTGFATWAILLGNGNPTPPPVATPAPLPNPAGFGLTYVPDAAPVENAPQPKPTAPPPWQCRPRPPPSTPP